MRMKLKYRKKINFKFKILVGLLVFFLLIFLFVLIFNKLSIYIIEYSKEETINYTSDIVNNSIDDNTLKLLDNDNLYQITRNQDNEIEMIDYNTYLANIILKNIVNNIENGMSSIENNIAFYVPFGVIFNNFMFSNLGPNLPVRIKLISSVLSSIETKIKDYGINNSLIEISVNIELKERIMLPLMSDVITYNISIPISYKIVNGKIPTYYGGSIIKSSE